MKFIICLIILFYSTLSFAENELPLLKAHSAIIDILEGNIMHLEAWEASSDIDLDEYVFNNFKSEATISFISDIDSISFNVKPNQTYDFIIQLDNNEKAYTRINTDSKKQGVDYQDIKSLLYTVKTKNHSNQPTIIPFTIGEDNRIYLNGTINNSQELKIIFDTGANAVVLKSSLVGSKVNLVLDGETNNTGGDGVSIKKTSSKNKVKIGNLIWDNVTISSIYYKANSGSKCTSK